MRNQKIVLRCAALALVLAAALSFSSRAQAQSDRPLFNIKEFGLDVFGFDEDSDACGIEEAYIKEVALIAGRALLPFKVIDTVEIHSVIWLIVESFRTKDRCITHILSQATYSVMAQLPYSREEDIARIDLWSKTDFIVTEHDTNAHRRAVVQRVAEQMESLAKDWKEQNETRL